MSRKLPFSLFIVTSDSTSCPSFDQARLIRHHRYLAANGVDSSGESPLNLVRGYYTTSLAGMPLDAKAVTRL
jgi:hypothetical protein